MWKKFLAAMAIVGLVSTTTTFALDVNPQPGGGNNGVQSYINNFAVSPASFNPSAGEQSTVSFDLAQAADLYVYAVDNTFVNIYEIVGSGVAPVATQAGAKTYKWNGKNAQGNALPNGTYTIKAFASVNGSIVDFDSKDVAINFVAPVDPNAPKITNLVVVPSKFSPSDNEDTEIAFDVDKGAYVTVVVKNELIQDGSVVRRTFEDFDGTTWYAQNEDISISWDGTENNGAIAPPGEYTVEVTAKNDDGEATKTISVEVEGTSSVSDGVIEKLTLDPSSVWDPTDEELEIEFELTEDVKSLTIDIKKGNKVVEILDDKFVDDGDVEESFDGTDDDGDYLKEGVYEVIVRADGDKVSKFIEIKYEEPSITDAFVTKTEFDPTEDEFTNLVFRLDAAAEVTVVVYKGNKKEFTLLEDESVKKNRYYTVAWDGYDEDGDKVTEGNDWKFKIEAKNATESDVMDAVTVEVDVQEDDVSDKKSNVTNDYTSPVVYDDSVDAVISVNYCIDEEAEVSISIHKGSSISGASEIDLLDGADQSKGCHTVSWEAVDENGKDLKDGVYSYKVITKANGSNKETEVGKFVVGTGEDQTPEPPKPPKPPVTSDCGGYWDTSFVANANTEMCAAIDWATEEGIFHGYNDGSFGVYMPINRAEVLKTILEAYNVTIFAADGTNQGLTDVDVNAWYMPYVRTGKFFGMVKGYPNGTFMPGSYVNRAEVLKLALEASHSFTSYTIPAAYQSNYADVAMDAWFINYAQVSYSYILMDEGYDVASGKPTLNPGAVVTRGEVALLLYRMYKSGLLGDYFGWEIPFEEMEVAY